MFLCLHGGWQRFVCQMQIVIVLLEYKAEGDRTDTEGYWDKDKVTQTGEKAQSSKEVIIIQHPRNLNNAIFHPLRRTTNICLPKMQVIRLTLFTDSVTKVKIWHGCNCLIIVGLVLDNNGGMNEQMNENSSIYMVHKNFHTKPCCVQSAKGTQHIHVSSHKLKLPKDIHPNTVQQPLPPTPAGKCNNTL